ncbi:MAG TPA: hypothetical protein VGP30_02825 [Candidatus Limnocylindrales bacterium]|nr:hypothetical protein [Candidatus Limnocylindrales bacterium]
MPRVLEVAAARRGGQVSSPAGVMRIVLGVAAMLKGITTASVLARFADPGVMRVAISSSIPTITTC